MHEAFSITRKKRFWAHFCEGAYYQNVRQLTLVIQSQIPEIPSWFISSYLWFSHMLFQWLHFWIGFGAIWSCFQLGVSWFTWNGLKTTNWRNWKCDKIFSLQHSTCDAVYVYIISVCMKFDTNGTEAIFIRILQTQNTLQQLDSGHHQQPLNAIFAHRYFVE